MITLLLLACATDSSPPSTPPSPELDETLEEPVEASEGMVFLNPTVGTMSWLEAGESMAHELELGAWPYRWLRTDQGVLVSLRGEGKLALVDTEGSLPELLRTVEVGAEPCDLALSADGERVYVALAMENAVLELDAASLEPLRRFETRGQVQWLALHPTDQVLYASSSLGRSVERVQLASGDVTEVELPTPRTFAGGATSSTEQTVVRPTGDIAVYYDEDAGTGVLVVPGMSTDVTTPEGTDNVVTGYYSSNASNPDDPGRFNPVLVAWTLDAYGQPQEAEVLLLIGRNDDNEFVRSYPAGAFLEAGDDTVYVPMPSSDVVLSFELGRTLDYGTTRADFLMTSPRTYQVGAGPEEVLFREDGAWVHNRRDRTATHVALPSDEVLTSYLSMSDELEEGRRLFNTAVDAEMVLSGAGMTCSNCHFEGRTDGLVYPFAAGPRQTPSLAGDVSGTAPYTWTDEVGSVAEEVRITNTTRLGGSGISEEQSEAVASWIVSTGYVDLPEQDDEAVSRGEALFRDLSCDSCHPAPLYGATGERYDMFDGEDMDVPSLVGVAASPPYYHDGSAETLRDALLLAEDGGMAAISHLDEEELNDLEAFLRTL